VARPFLSVVIPALDEEPSIEAAVRSVRDGADEVLVVDGGSTDGTAARAREAGARVIPSTAGRGLQLRRGADESRGEWILFLHADTRLDSGWADELRGLGPRSVGGAFRLAIESPRVAYRVIEAGVRLRCRLFGLPYGDQALFARRAAYEACGGMPAIPLMEDVAFVRRLRSRGPLVFLRTRARTSPRRWERGGVVRTTAHNLRFLALYALGRPPERLAAAYRSPPPEVP